MNFRRKVSLIVITIIVILMFVLVLAVKTPTGLVIGDRLNNPRSTVDDAYLVVNHLLGARALSGQALTEANFNCDPSGTVDLQDLYLVLDDIINPGSVPSCASVSSDQLYNQRIVLMTGSSTGLSDLAQNELAYWLNRITSQSFNVETVNPSDVDSRAGIYLVLADSPFLQTNAPVEVLSQLPALQQATAGESYLVVSDAQDRLWIIGKQDSAIGHGIFYYLESLGMRWFMPADHWTIVPALSTLRQSINVFRTPVFRTFVFGVGMGWGGILPIQNFQAPDILWNNWFKHRQLPQEGVIAGETDFMYAKENELRMDPLYMAEVSGQRQSLPPRPPSGAFNIGVKYDPTYHGSVACNDPQRTLIPFDKRNEDTKTLTCPQDLGSYAVVSYIDQSGVQYCEDPCDYTSYDGLVELFTEYTITWFKRLLTRSPTSYSISVEPPDGPGFDESWKTKNLLRNGPYNLNSNVDSTDSDATFHLANIVARRIAQEVSGAFVNLYAYNTHASPPVIPIEANTIVILAPFAFHFIFTKLLPEELIDAWQQKQQTNPPGTFRLGIYDYWASPNAVADLPFVGVELAAERLRLYAQEGITETFNGESSPAAGHLGLTWYIASKMAWDINADVDGLKNEFYTLAFGPASASMKRLFDRWHSKNFLLTAHELGLSYQDLQQATMVAQNDPAVLARIDDIKRYLHYVRLRFEWEKLQKGSPAKFTKAEELTMYTWRIYNSLMVHSYGNNALLWFYYRDQEPTPTYLARWNFQDLDPVQPGFQNSAPGFVDVQQNGPVTSQELNQLMNDGMQSYSPLLFTEASFSEQLVPLPSSASGAIVTTNIYGTTIGKVKYQLYSAGRSIPLAINVYGPATLPGVKVKITDVNGNVLYNNDLAIGAVENLVLNFPRGINFIEVTNFFISTGFSFSLPNDVPFVRVGDINFWGLQGKKNYFYVPAGTSRIVLFAETPVIPKIYNPLNQLTTVQMHGPNLFYVDVPPNFQKGIWSISEVPTLNKNLRFFTTPNVFSPTPEQLMIPVGVQ